MNYYNLKFYLNFKNLKTKNFIFLVIREKLTHPTQLLGSALLRNNSCLLFGLFWEKLSPALASIS